VEKAYNTYPAKLLNRNWITFRQVMNEVIDHNGDNNYELPHMGKARLERLGLLQPVLDATANAYSYL
jgi:hypothetical protein